MSVKKAKPVKVTKRDKEGVQTGKRKESVARARVVNDHGTGRLTINRKPIVMWGTMMNRLWVTEPALIAGDAAKTLDIDIVVRGGGTASQAEAVRVAIAKALVSHTKDKKLKARFLEADRNLLVYDPRRTEPHKPSRSKKGARVHKQRSKR